MEPLNLDPKLNLLAWRSQRQQVLASNIANADTPGFKAKDLAFSSVMSEAKQGLGLAKTNANHLSLQPTGKGNPNLVFRTPAQNSIDGNTVEPEKEAAHFTDNGLKFEAALKAVSHDFSLMKSAISNTP